MNKQGNDSVPSRVGTRRQRVEELADVVAAWGNVQGVETFVIEVLRAVEDRQRLAKEAIDRMNATKPDLIRERWESPRSLGEGG